MTTPSTGAQTRRSTIKVAGYQMPVTREVAARVLLDAVFLVPARGARRFQSAVERAQTSLAENGCEVTLTGPWPPYHFVDGGRRAKQ